MLEFFHYLDFHLQFTFIMVVFKFELLMHHKVYHHLIQLISLMIPISELAINSITFFLKCFD